MPEDDVRAPDDVDDAPDDASRDAPDASDPDAASAGRSRIAPVVALLVGVALFIAAGVAFLSASADGDDLAEAAGARDAVQVEATEAIEVLNTLDARDVDAGLAQWAAVSTGDLREELTDLTESQRDALSEVAQISEGTVVSLAVTRLDTAAGESSVIAFVEKKVGATEAEVREAAPSRIQFAAELVEEDGSWKVATLTPEAVVTPEGAAR